MPRRVWSGTGWLVGGRLFGSLASAATWVLLARHLPTEEFGRAGFYVALFYLLESLVDLGTGTATVRLAAQDPASLRAVLLTVRRVRGATAFLSFLIVTAVATILGEPDQLLLIVAALGAFSRVPEANGVAFQSNIEWRPPVLLRAGAATLRLALVGMGLLLDWQLAGAFVLAHVSATTIGNLAVGAAARARMPINQRPPIPLRELLALALPLGLAAVCQQAYFHVDHAFVRALCGDEELGHYTACARLFSFLVLFGSHAGIVALPWLARPRQPGALGAATRRFTAPIFIAGCTFLGTLHPHAETLLSVLFGESFSVAAPDLRWLLIAAAAVYAGAGLVTAVVGAGKARTALTLTAAGLVVNLVANAILVPEMGSTGAAAATAVTELFVCLGAARALSVAGERSLTPFFILGPLCYGGAAWLSSMVA